MELQVAGSVPSGVPAIALPAAFSVAHRALGNGLSAVYGSSYIEVELSRMKTTFGNSPDCEEKKEMSPRSSVVTPVGWTFWMTAELTRQSLALHALVWASDCRG